MSNPFTRRFFDSTRGQIILLLRHRAHTVSELAEALGLTDNAIRAHLAVLERDQLACQKGERPGFRKPHLSYELTPEAEEIFPKAYAPTLNILLSVIKSQYGVQELRKLLACVGQTLLDDQPIKKAEGGEPVDLAVAVLERLGGQARVEKDGATVRIHGIGCPLSAVTADHEEACVMVADVLSEVAGVEVVQHCSRDCAPHCQFEIACK